MSLKCFITKNMTKRFHIMKLGVFRLCRFTATGSILSSAQWVCSDDLPWMIINEIGAHYDESMLIINLFFPPLLIMIKVGSNASPWEVPVLVLCHCLVSRGKAAAWGLGPPYGSHMHPVFLLM